MIEYDEILTQRVNGKKIQTRIIAKIETHCETVADAAKRQRLAYLQGQRTDIDATDPDVLAVAFLHYPAMVACSSGTIQLGEVEIDVRKLDYDTFVLLPGPLFVAWESRVYDDNPHILEINLSDTDETAEKKSASSDK